MAIAARVPDHSTTSCSGARHGQKRGSAGRSTWASTHSPVVRPSIDVRRTARPTPKCTRVMMEKLSDPSP
jgi:hypothetical protein